MEKVLEQLLVRDQLMLPSGLQHVELKVEEARAAKRLAVSLSAYVLAERLADDHYTTSFITRQPATTWQMFRSRHAESWWLRWHVRRWPIKWETTFHRVDTKFTRYATYPRAEVAVPPLGQPVLWDQVSSVVDG